MSRLDPSAQRALLLASQLNGPNVRDVPPQQSRQAYLDRFARLQRPLEHVAETSEMQIGPLRAKLWRGHGADRSKAPALLYLHGGGWVIGAPETHEDICRALANLTQAVVISPDYRLAPEHPLPAALDDCAATLRHMAEHASGLGIDPHRIAVAGDSAGGNLAAVLALMARDGHVANITAQLLIYPVTDQQQTSESFRSFAQDHGLSADDMAWFRDQYLGGADRANWRVAPIRAASLVGVAPAFVVLAGHDVLHDEGAAYAARLEREAQATARCWPGQIHGFVSMGGVIPEAQDALLALSDAWKVIDPLFVA